jgi:hypothetical protein
MVTGCYPHAGQLRTVGYPIICTAAMPVLNV